MASEAQARADARIAGVEWGQQAEGWGRIEGFGGGRRCCEGRKGWCGGGIGGGARCKFLQNDLREGGGGGGSARNVMALCDNFCHGRVPTQ